jgi:hypothetical protein
MELELHALQLHAMQLLDLPNVVGVGIGPKTRGGMRSGETAVVVLVSHKLKQDELLAESIVPPFLEGVATDIMEVGEIRFLGRTSLSRPAHPGASIGHYKVSAGTFGAVVYDKKTEMPLILSNNHILANISNGRDGRSAVGDPIYQPGSYDGGTSEDVIGTLYRFVPINYQEKEQTGDKRSAANRVDAAVAKPLSPEIIDPAILEVGCIKGTIQPEMNMKVQKSGRTSGVTYGRIRVMHTTLKVDMDENRYAVFEDQVVTDMVSKPGDSGSLVLAESGEAVGLLFAGSNRSAIFNPIQNVLSALDVTMFGKNTHQSPTPGESSEPVGTDKPVNQPVMATAPPPVILSVLLLLVLIFFFHK